MVTGLGQGAYYWAIQSYDASGKESVESEKNRFTIIPRTQEKVELSLDLDPFIQHGHVIEVLGKTENGARVMVNGREVPLVADDGSFHYFTPPREFDHGDGAEFQRRCEYPSGKGRDSVGFLVFRTTEWQMGAQVA
jgi:hypothetical protein